MQQKLDNGFVVDTFEGKIYLRAPNGRRVDGECHQTPHVFRSVDEAIETAGFLYETGECSVVGGIWSRRGDEANSKLRRTRIKAEIALQNALANIDAPNTSITFANEAIGYLRTLTNDA